LKLKRTRLKSGEFRDICPFTKTDSTLGTPDEFNKLQDVFGHFHLRLALPFEYPVEKRHEETGAGDTACHAVDEKEIRPGRDQFFQLSRYRRQIVRPFESLDLPEPDAPKAANSTGDNFF